LRRRRLADYIRASSSDSGFGRFARGCLMDVTVSCHEKTIDGWPILRRIQFSRSSSRPGFKKDFRSVNEA